MSETDGKKPPRRRGSKRRKRRPAGDAAAPSATRPLKAREALARRVKVAAGAAFGLIAQGQFAWGDAGVMLAIASVAIGPVLYLRAVWARRPRPLGPASAQGQLQALRGREGRRSREMGGRQLLDGVLEGVAATTFYFYFFSDYYYSFFRQSMMNFANLKIQTFFIRFFSFK